MRLANFVKHYRITKEEYDAIENKNPNAIYFIIDTGEIYMDGKCYSKSGGGDYPTDPTFNKVTTNALEVVNNDFIVENTLRFENNDSHTYLTIGNSENSIITLTGKVINLLNDNEGYVYLNPFNTMLYFKEDESYKDLATIVTTYDERIKALEDMGKRLDDINGEVIE